MSFGLPTDSNIHHNLDGWMIQLHDFSGEKTVSPEMFEHFVCFVKGNGFKLHAKPTVNYRVSTPRGWPPLVVQNFHRGCHLKAVFLSLNLLAWIPKPYTPVI